MRITRLSLVSVPRPCKVSWDAMSGQDTARLCAECGRHVHDFAAMPSDEAETLLARTGERVCVRLSRGPDGHVITADRPARFKPRPWFQGIPAATLVTLLSTANLGAAEPHASGGLRGKLTIDVTNDVAVGAEVVAENVETGEEFKTVARMDGSYRLPLPRGRYNVHYTETGFESCGFGNFRAGWLPMRVDVAFRLPILGEYVAPCSTYDSRNFFVRMVTAPVRAVKRLFARES